jgi:hypothetical protein
MITVRDNVLITIHISLLYTNILGKLQVSNIYKCLRDEITIIHGGRGYQSEVTTDRIMHILYSLYIVHKLHLNTLSQIKLFLHLFYLISRNILPKYEYTI